MTGTTEQATAAGVAGSTAGTGVSNGDVEVRDPAPAELPLEDLDGIEADGLPQGAA